MKLISIASSSHGNCHILYDGFSGIMLDCGVSFDGYNHLLDEYNVKNILLTHRHSDHTKGLLNGKLFIGSIVAHGSDETIASLTKTMSFNKKVVVSLKQHVVGDFTVLPIQVPHDVECFSYVLKNNHTGENTLYLTDCGMASQFKIKNITNFIIECNYAKKYYDDNENLSEEAQEKYKRLSGKYGHISVEDVICFLKNNIDEDKTKNVVLTHISRDTENYKEFETMVKNSLKSDKIKVVAISNRIKNIDEMEINEL